MSFQAILAAFVVKYDGRPITPPDEDCRDAPAGPQNSTLSNQVRGRYTWFCCANGVSFLDSSG